MTSVPLATLQRLIRASSLQRVQVPLDALREVLDEAELARALEVTGEPLRVVSVPVLPIDPEHQALVDRVVNEARKPALM